MDAITKAAWILVATLAICTAIFAQQASTARAQLQVARKAYYSARDDLQQLNEETAALKLKLQEQAHPVDNVSEDEMIADAVADVKHRQELDDAKRKKSVAETEAFNAGKASEPATSSAPANSTSTSGDWREQVLDAGGGEQDVMCATDKAAFDEMTKAAGRKDAYGLAELAMAGRVLLVPRGTRARYLEGGFTFSVLRITSGDYEGTKVWTYNEFVKDR